MNPEIETFEKCLNLTAAKSALGDPPTWTKRDYSQLSQLIVQETGVLLSTSTLIRLFRKDFRQRPQKSTLDALARYIGFESWYEFNRGTETAIIEPSQERVKPISRRSLRFLPVTGFVILLKLILTVILSLINQRKINPANVSFRILNTSPQVGFHLQVWQYFSLTGPKYEVGRVWSG